MTFIVNENTQDGYDRSLSDDLVWGVKALAVEIGRTERQTFHLLERGLIPGRKLGGRWVASRSALRQSLAEPAAR